MRLQINFFREICSMEHMQEWNWIFLEWKTIIDRKVWLRYSFSQKNVVNECWCALCLKIHLRKNRWRDRTSIGRISTISLHNLSLILPIFTYQIFKSIIIATLKLWQKLHFPFRKECTIYSNGIWGSTLYGFVGLVVRFIKYLKGFTT